MNIILFGAPGVGKGTQAQLLAKRRKLKHLSTGDMFREAIKSGSDLGKQVSTYINKGDLVPDALTISLIKEKLSQKSKDENGFLFDGFPRTLKQAQDLDSLLSSLGQRVDHVFYLKLEETEIVERLSGRRMAPQSGKIYHIKYSPPKKEGVCDISGETLIQREDDFPVVIEKRLENYKKQSLPLLEHYNQKSSLVKEISAKGSPEDLFQKITAWL